MELNNQILSQITVFNKYSKYLPDKKRRETWDEICDRYENMMIEKYPGIKQDIISNAKYIRDKKVLPSMRALQFAGPAITRNNARLFNCSYLPIDHIDCFSEIMFLLLGGTGVGYSVQKHHIDELPEIRKPFKNRRFLVGDSLEGWADCIKVLMKSYFGKSSSYPVFDYSDIRPKGARLKTAGGKAPGSAPLQRCVVNIQAILDSKKDGDKLTSLEVHDIICHVANAVLSGGIRRSALISLFSFDDENMIGSKSGNWWELNEQRGRANNSAVIIRNKVTKEEFDGFWEKIKFSNAGEPGIYFTNDKDWGANPCVEISLRANQFCNLTTVNVSDIKDQDDLNKRVQIAAFFGTLQAGFTDFHYLRDIWKKTTEKEALIGVSMTGIASGEILKYSLEESAIIVKDTNEYYAKLIGINKAARCTAIKPEGTASCVLGTSSGIHAWHSEYYIRRMRVGKDEAMYKYLSIVNPELLEDEYFKPYSQAIIQVPQKAPLGAIMRTETPIELLERVKLFHNKWIKIGHRKGVNTHNVSATISIKEEEWEEVGKWMWENKESYNGLSVIPYDTGTYKQAPFQDITEEEYNSLFSKLKDINLEEIFEDNDETDLTGELACSGNNCELK